MFLCAAAGGTDMLMKEKQQRGIRFVGTDQVEVHHILGMVVKRDRGNKTMKILQQKLLEGIFKMLKLENLVRMLQTVIIF